MANPRVTFDFKADISQINQAIQKIDQRLDKFGSKAKQHTEGFAGGMAKFGLAVSGVQQAFGLLDQTIGAVARKVVDIGGNFEHTMNKVKAVSGASVADFNRLRDSALEFGSSTAKSATDVGKLQFELSKLGFKTEEIMKSTEGILNLSIAFDVDLARSASVAGGVLRQFSLDASEAGMVADMMAVAFSSTALDTEKFANAMVYVGQIAPQAGFEVHEVTALLGVLSDKMVDSSIAGTALTKIMEQMANPQSDLTKEIGHTVTGYDGFVEVLQHMKTTGKDLTDFLGFVLPRTAKTFGVLVESANDIDKLTKSLENVKGASKDMADIMLDDLIGAQLLVDSAMEGLWIRIATELTPAFMNLKKAQIAFIQDIDTEEIYSYTAGFVAMGVAVAYFNRQALLTVLRLKAVKVALATSGWGLAVVGLGLLAGAIIDATNVFGDETDAIDDNTDAMQRNKEMQEAISKAREDITQIEDIKLLRIMKAERVEILEKIEQTERAERSVWKIVKDGINRKKVDGEYIAKLGAKEWKWILIRARTRVEEHQKAIAEYQEQQFWQDMTTEQQRKQLLSINKILSNRMFDEQVLISLQGKSVKEVQEYLKRAKETEALKEGEIAMIDIQIARLQLVIDTEKESTATTEQRLVALDKITKAEIKQRQVVLAVIQKFDDRVEDFEATRWEKKKNRLDREEDVRKDKVRDLIDLEKFQMEEIQSILDNDQSVTADKKRAEREAEVTRLAKAVAENEGTILRITEQFNKERMKIVDERVEAEAEAREDRIAQAQEMGFVLQGEEQRNFDVYIEFLDAKLEAEELYSEKWFELMEHRQQKYDENIDRQLERGTMSDVQHMQLISKQLQNEELTVERRIELQEQLHDATIGFMASGALSYKSFAKQKLVTFITEQQIKLLGKLAEIMAMGASTLGVSLAFQLPMYGVALAVLEGAKSKVMAFEKGGLIEKPTLALMGEAGTELVIPEQGFKDYVKSQIIPFQAQQLGVPLSNFTNQNYIQNTVSMTKQEELTQINTNAIQKMSSEIGLLTKTMNMPQGVTITDGSSIISAEMERGRLN